MCWSELDNPLSPVCKHEWFISHWQQSFMGSMGLRNRLPISYNWVVSKLFSPVLADFVDGVTSWPNVYMDYISCPSAAV